MKLELTQKLQQQQILAPQMILSMDILLLAAQDLQQRIEKEFTENPALEVVDAGLEESRNDAATTTESAPKESESFDKIESFSDNSFEIPSIYRKARVGGSDDKFEALQNTEGRPPGLRDFLGQQLRLLQVETSVQELGEEIINNLDRRGYLVSTEEELFTSLEHRVSRKQFDDAIDAVRSLDPPGIGAQDLQQCLLLQLERDRQEYPLETRIILNHLEDLRENRIPKISKELKTSIEEIEEALHIIRCLDPAPGSQYQSEATVYVRPDVIVEVHDDDKIDVRIESSGLPKLNVSDSCKNLLTRSRKHPEVQQFVRRKIESAQWLIQAIQQRQRTLQDISVAVVDYQREFMLKGTEQLRAMKMQAIADIVGVHISTVSRAIKGKYIQTPWGTFEMRYFFTGGVGNADGEVESRRNIYRKISDIIENENKSRPLSDSAIAKLLQKNGLSIARRTVSKYREQEKIPSSRLRKNHWVQNATT